MLRVPSPFGIGSPFGQLRAFDPASLFAGGIAGAWYGPSDLSTLFKDSAGTTPVTTPGQPVGLMLDKSGNDNHPIQATAAARPTYQVTPDRITVDKVDDRLPVTVPVGGFTGTMVLATDQGTASYGVTIPAGAYNIGGRGGQYFPGGAIVGQLIRDGALSAGEAAATEAYFVENGATAGYGSVTDFAGFWREWSEITSFPLIDTSSGTVFDSAWRDCSSLTSFSPIDTSSGTSFSIAWYNCTSLTSFPLIDTSSGTRFIATWRNCSSLTSFPLIDTSSGTDFARAWRGCSGLTTIPAGLFDNISGGDFADAFRNTALTQTSIDNILVSLVASGIATGTRVFDQSGGSAPSATGEAAIDTLRSRGWIVTVTGGYSSSSPSALFAGGTEGAWYDPSDIDTLFQDSAGTTPVTASGQPVGKMLDKSGNGNHATQATSSKRPTYTEGGGLAWLHFDGVDDEMEAPNAAFNLTGDLTMGFAISADSTLKSEYLCGGVDDDGHLLLFSAVDELRYVPMNSSGEVRTGQVPESNALVLTSWDRSTGDFAVTLDSAETTESKTAADVVAPSQGFTLIAAGNPGGKNFNGRIYGVILRGSLNSESEKFLVKTYLASLQGRTL